jgi:hypothetical protein
MFSELENSRGNLAISADPKDEIRRRMIPPQRTKSKTFCPKGLDGGARETGATWVMDQVASAGWPVRA